MNSQTHMIMGALITGKQIPRLAWAGVLGGVLPDLPMYAIIAVLAIQGYSFNTIFGEIYWEQWWQIANGVGHSFIVWGVAAIVSGYLLSRQFEFKEWFKILTKTSFVFAVSISAFLHALIDFFCHRNDAHMQFWPLTEWRFRSPISYWDPAHFGLQFTFFEAIVGIILAILMFKRYSNIWIRVVTIIALCLYVAMPILYLS